MGKVFVSAKIENLYDLGNHQRGLLSADKVRSVEVSDALVDTGATFSMPKRLIAQLGLFRGQSHLEVVFGQGVALLSFSYFR